MFVYIRKSPWYLSNILNTEGVIIYVGKAKKL